MGLLNFLHSKILYKVFVNTHLQTAHYKTIPVTIEYNNQLKSPLEKNTST